MRKTIRNSLVVILILVLSLGIGLVYCRICEKIERKTYPREFSEIVSKYSESYGIPELILYSVIKVESDFQSNAVSSAGAVGLMQITPTTCEWVSVKLGEVYNVALLYDPETNIRYGAYLLSFLKLRYENWDTVFAAYNAGHGRVDSWLEDPEYSDGNGVLKKIPFAETRAYVKLVDETRKIYERLYS